MTAEHSTQRYVHNGSDLSRVISISDGLFATVLTLLVLEIKLPAMLPGTGVLDAMVALWPKLFSYLLTFMVAGTYWVAHHYDFQHIARFDRRLMWINLMFLLCIGVLPASTALVGTNQHSQPLAWIVYALNMILGGVMLTAVWGYAVARHMIDPTLHPHLVRYVTARHLVAPAVFLLSIGVALVAPHPVASMTPLLVTPAHLLLNRFFVDHTSPTDADDEDVLPTLHDMLWRVLSLLPLIGFAGWSLWVWLAYSGSQPR